MMQGSDRHGQTNRLSMSELHTYSPKILVTKDGLPTLAKIRTMGREASSRLSFPDKRWVDLAHLSVEIFDIPCPEPTYDLQHYVQWTTTLGLKQRLQI